MWDLPKLQVLELSNNLTGTLSGNFSDLRRYIDTVANSTTSPNDSSSTYIQSVVITVNDRVVTYTTFLSYVIPCSYHTIKWWGKYLQMLPSL